MESQNHLAAINDTLNVLIQRFDAMEARQDSSDARFEKLYLNFMDKCDMGLHHPFIKTTSPISFEKSNQVVLKLQSFHEEKIRAREKVDEFFSQYRPRYKPKSDPCLRPKLAKFKKIRNKHHNDKKAFVPIIGFESLLPATRLLLDSTCIQGSAFLVSNVQQSNCTDHGYERVGSVKERFKSLDFSISDGIAIDFSIRFDVGFILDAKQMLIPTEVAGVHLGRDVFDELPHSTNNCVLQLGYHMPISDSGGTLIILVCNVEFLQNGTRDLRHYIELLASNFGDKESDESKIMVVGLYHFMKAQPTILENKCQKEWVGMYAHHLFVGMQQTADMASLKLGFHEFIRDKGGTKFLFSFESIDLLASCKDSCFCVVIDRSMGYNHKGIRDKGGSFSQRLFNSKSTNQDCVLGSDCSKVIKCEVSFDSSVIIDEEDAGKLGLHQFEACMDKNRKHERRFTLSRFGNGCCVVCSVVLDRDYYKGIRDKGGGSKFRNVAVGNELFLETYNGSFLRTTFPAVQNVQSAPIKAGLSNQVKVTALQNADVYASCGDFRIDIHDYMIQIVKFLSDSGCPFTVNIYPFISLYIDSNFPVDYAFFDGNASPIIDGSATYYNMFDANYDILMWTLQKNGFGNLPIIVEIGWPTDGDRNANLVYAQRFNQGFMSHILSGRGTPMRPGPIDAYPFSLIDKNAKSIDPGHFERHWGIFTSDGLAKYQLNLGSTNSEALVPATGMHYMARKWCVMKPSASYDDPQVALSVSYACGLADCTSLGYGTSCGNLDGRGNISYTVNIYYQRNNQLDEVCKIPNLSMITETNPSVGSCRNEIWASPKASEPDCPFEPVFMGFQEYSHGFAGWRDRVEHLFADMHFKKLISQRFFNRNVAAIYYWHMSLIVSKSTYSS